MTRTDKDIFKQTIRTKWPYKKHTHASVNQIYELRGRISRKIKVWLGGSRLGTPSLVQYLASKRIAKRVTSGYGRRLVDG
jgi:hypothetical protein